jgi:polysaccharide biosynthesis/export protein
MQNFGIKIKMTKISKNKNLYNLARNFLVIIIALLTMQSCKVSQKSSYFKTLALRDTTINNFVKNDFESVIMPGDELAIGVTSLSIVEDGIFNSAAAVSKDASGYTVLQDGNIVLHRLGATKAAGLTRKELAKKIQNGLLAFTKEPIVKVEYLNHKLTVIGEVKSPQIIKLPQEQISILDALILSGDLTEAGKRNDIIIIREEGNDKKVKHINLEDHSIFTSEWYYVKPNDIILVNADNKKIETAERKQKFQNTLTLVTTGLSLVLVVLSRFVK